MSSKIHSLFSENVTYTLSVIALATAVCYVLKILLEEVLKLYKLWNAVRKVPGPRGLPVLGVLHDLLGNTECVLKKFVEWSERYPSPCSIWLGHKLHFIFCDPDSIKELLEKHKVIEKPPIYGFTGMFLGNGLLTAPGKEWRVHRKLVTTVFNVRTLSPYSEFFAEKVQEMVNEMEIELDGKEFEVRNYIEPCILKMIFGVALGTSLKFETEELHNFHNDISRAAEIIFIRMIRIWLYPDFIFKRTTLGRECIAAIERLSTAMKKTIKRADEKENDPTAKGRKESEALTGLFMKLPRGTDDYTDEDFFYELNTFIVAGSHSLAFQMTCLTRMLAYNPDIQDKIYEEIYGIYGSTDPADRPVIREDLSRLEYLECAIQETMRLFPPIPFIARDIATDMDIESCVLPAGSTVMISLVSMLRKKEYWPNSLKFDPDRFLPENLPKIVPGAYLPFSCGPRNCPGGKYAIMAGKIFIATLLRRYTLRADTIVPVENIKLQANVVMDSIEPWTLRIEERNPGKIGTKNKSRDI